MNAHGPAASRSEIERSIAAVWRLESAKIIAVLARMLRDVGVAEELAQEALIAALERWPQDGLPDKPGAWLMTTARNRALDHLRAAAMQQRKHEELAREQETLGLAVVPDHADSFDERRADDIGDELLRLIFIACHPVLPREARLALTLKLLGGLSTAEIARAFLAQEATIAQRIVRAKRSLQQARVPFELPAPAQRQQRLASVLEVIYLIFNEGYSATAGEDWLRPALCDEALRLGRVLAELSPEEAEVHGLVALMEIQASRQAARVDAQGRAVLLMAQDRARWDHLLIRRGLAALSRAQALQAEPGPYQLQAGIAACHARASRAEQTDWLAILALYEALLALQPTPVVALNRAVALSMCVGPELGPAAALPLVEALLDEPAMAAYPWAFSVHGDLLERLGRGAEAARAFRHAASLTANARDRELLLERAARCH